MLARARTVTQHQPADCQLIEDRSSGSIVIPCDPHPIERALQRRQHSCRIRLKPHGTMRIMEIVAKAKHPPRTRLAHRHGQPFQRLAAVIGRQHLAVARKKACLFQMQICHQQGILARPEQRAALH